MLSNLFPPKVPQIQKKFQSISEIGGKIGGTGSQSERDAQHNRMPLKILESHGF